MHSAVILCRENVLMGKTFVNFVVLSKTVQVSPQMLMVTICDGESVGSTEYLD